ncbi:unnamed protein product [Tilletia controversa]|uniref:Zn(2)-C6 fungal-type domain-containing protein n=2 Tax=Tilletia TaxID=13289 RepID=A0A177URN2_9BASI|nr:hypothetical protein CF336_g3992 [Tilletia laevis]KAE8259233.1 hypothetical protein A4X03_0g4147 [Tilletia caries]CAD6928353.1 unnamed protein product [Tilletia controversa]KAE8199057.1 hypothetical protein CF335_g4254 [Tilletia laevis]CAD6893667.1 unnamed protein product [Tilletia caries]
MPPHYSATHYADSEGLIPSSEQASTPQAEASHDANRVQHHDLPLALDPPPPFDVNEETRAAYDAATTAAAAAAAAAAVSSGQLDGAHLTHPSSLHHHDDDEDYNATLQAQNTEAITLAALAAARASGEILAAGTDAGPSSTGAGVQDAGVLSGNAGAPGQGVPDDIAAAAAVAALVTAGGEGAEDGSSGSNNRTHKRPRAKALMKIKRTRKITSCLQCRDRKQKCDRVHPTCGTCHSLGIAGCTYVDNSKELRTLQAQQQDQEHEGNSLGNGTYPDSSEDAASAPSTSLLGKRKRNDNILSQGSPSTLPGGLESAASASVPPHTLSLDPQEATRRAELLQATAALAKDRANVDWTTKVRAVRAVAVAGILFSSPHLHLPRFETVREVLESYERTVGSLDGIGVPVIVLPLLWARIEKLLSWWHDGMRTMPADPVLVPLLLVLLALGIQTKRTAPDGSVDPRRGSDDSGILNHTSSERILIEIAERMERALQVACPSHWVPAHQAPLDLIRATLLRGIWHANELHLAYASSCFSSAVGLAHRAGLHRDPSHWSSSSSPMGEAEALGRRELWWTCVSWEVLHSLRTGNQPAFAASTFAEMDTAIESQHEVVTRIFDALTTAAAGDQLGLGLHRRVPPNKATFEFQRARFELARLLLAYQVQLGALGSVAMGGRGNGPAGSATTESDRQETLSLAFDNWKGALPPRFTILDDDKLDVIAAQFDGSGQGMVEEAELGGTAFLQRGMLHLAYLQAQIAAYRPTAGVIAGTLGGLRDVTRCLSAAQGVVELVIRMLEKRPPVLIASFVGQAVFSAALVLAIHVRLDSDSPATAQMRTVLERAIFVLQAIAATQRLHAIADEASRLRQTLQELLGRGPPSSEDNSAPDPVASTAASDGNEWRMSVDGTTDQNGVGGEDDDEERRTAVAAAAAAAAAAATAAASMADAGSSGSAAPAPPTAGTNGDSAAHSVFSHDWLQSLDRPSTLTAAERSIPVPGDESDAGAVVRRALAVSSSSSSAAGSSITGVLMSLGMPGAANAPADRLLGLEAAFPSNGGGGGGGDGAGMDGVRREVRVGDWERYSAEWKVWESVCREMMHH